MNTEGLETMMEAGLIDKDAKAWVTKQSQFYNEEEMLQKVAAMTVIKEE